tara:strand:- start:4223 stop:5533 length:1311 start_codon:yes stop_codon:yes gene_type:complete
MLDTKKKIKFSIYNLSALLFILIPYSLIFSIFLTEVILILISFISLKKNIPKLKVLVRENTLIKMLLIFYLIIVFSSFYNQSKFEIILKNLAYLRFIFYAISVSLILAEFKYLKKYFLFSLISCYLLLFFGSLYEYIFKRYCITFDESTVAQFTGNFRFCSEKYFIGNLIRPDRISSFFGDEMIVGSFTARVLPLVFFLIFDQINNLNRRITILSLTFFVSIVIVILSGERLSLFYLIIFSIIFLLYINIKYKYILFIFLTTFSYLIITSSTVLKDRIYEQTYSQIFKTDGSIKFFSVEHQSHAISAIEIFKDNPIIGIGPKNYRYECRKEKYNISKYSCTSHPHNFYLQLLSEVGILGILIPLIILINIFMYFLKIFYEKLTFKSDNQEIKKLLINMSFLITFFPIIPTGNIFNNWLSIIFYLPLGFFIFEKKNG